LPQQLLIVPAATTLASSTAAAATRNRQQTSRSGVRMNVRFGFVTELTVSLPNSSLRLDRTAACQWQLLSFASIIRLYQFVVALWRVNSAETIFSCGRPSRRTLCGDQGGSDCRGC
jgi:hypothetical protein